MHFGTDYTGATVGHQLVGGLAPMISGSLLECADGRSWPVAVHLIVLSAIMLVSVWLAAETHTSHLGEERESTD